MRACLRTLAGRTLLPVLLGLGGCQGAYYGALEKVVAARPDVFNHNLETVPGLYLRIRPGARYFHSLRLLQKVKELDPTMFTKSGFMVGLGEEREEILQLIDDLRSAVQRSEVNQAKVRHILIMLVNSNNRPHLEWALKQDTPSVLDMAAAVSSDQINRYSRDSIGITRLFFGNLAKQLSTEDKKVTFDFVRVDFEGVEDDAEREKLNNIGTSFRLSNAEVDLLISNARKVLRASPEFKTFLERVNGKTVGP